jgi:hypothetical protein
MPSPRNAARQLGSALALSSVGYLAVAANVRLMMQPKTLLQDWRNDPVPLVSAMLRFEPRADQSTLDEARDKVLGQFGAYIDPRSRCFDADADVVDFLPQGVEGHYSDEDNAVYIAPNHFSGGGMSAVHEYLHCFTHPKFLDKAFEATSEPHYANMLNEGVTHHLTRQVPIPSNQFYTSLYDLAHVGPEVARTPVELARTVVEAMGQDGEETLKKAYFSGDPAALKKLDDAMFQVLPRKVTPNAWPALQKIGGPMSKMRPEKLVEMFIGSMLIHSPQELVKALDRAIDTLPPATARQLDEWMRTRDADDPHNPATMLTAIRRQTLELRERIGADRFDTVFCRHNLDPRQRVTMMRELTDLWQPVLPKQISRPMIQSKWG